MSIVGFIIARSEKSKKNLPVAEKKNEDSILKINILMEGTPAAKKINNPKPNSNPDLKLENEDYNHYKKVKIVKSNKFYRK